MSLPTRITPRNDLGHLPVFSRTPILQRFLKHLFRNYMKIMLFLILVSLTVALGFLFAFLFAARNGQFDDDNTPAIRMLFDSTIPEENELDKKPDAVKKS